MEQNDGASDEQSERPAAAVLDRVESELTEADRVELSDDEMAALDIWTDRPGPPRQPAISTEKDVDPVGVTLFGESDSWKLFDVSDVDGRSNGDYLALETHTEQQGEPSTRPYATALGSINFEPSNVPDLDTLRDAIADKAPDEMPLPDDAQLNAVREFIARSAHEFADLALEGDVWAVAFDGSKLYVEPEVSRWDGFDLVASDVDLTEDQRRTIEMTGSESGWVALPRHIQYTDSFAFAVDVRFGDD